MVSLDVIERVISSDFFYNYIVSLRLWQECYFYYVC